MIPATTEDLRAYLDARGVDGAPTELGWCVTGSTTGIGVRLVDRDEDGLYYSPAPSARVTRHAPLVLAEPPLACNHPAACASDNAENPCAWCFDRAAATRIAHERDEAQVLANDTARQLAIEYDLRRTAESAAAEMRVALTEFAEIPTRIPVRGGRPAIVPRIIERARAALSSDAGRGWVSPDVAKQAAEAVDTFLARVSKAYTDQDRYDTPLRALSEEGIKLRAALREVLK